MLVPLVLAGCAAGSDPVHGVVSSIGLLPDQPEPKDFVKAARPDMDKIDYMPVEFNPQEHKLPVRTKAEAAADDRALEHLDPLAGALDHPHVHLHGVAGAELGDVVPQAVAVDDVGRVHWARLFRRRSICPPSATRARHPSGVLVRESSVWTPGRPGADEAPQS